MLRVFFFYTNAFIQTDMLKFAQFCPLPVKPGRPDLVLCLFSSSSCCQLTWASSEPDSLGTTRRLATVSRASGMQFAGDVGWHHQQNCTIQLAGTQHDRGTSAGLPLQGMQIFLYRGESVCCC